MLEPNSHDIGLLHARLNNDAVPLPFTRSLFDLVLAVDVFTAFDEATTDGWLKELKRVTRPGGLLLITANGLKSWTDALATLPELKKHEPSLAGAGFCTTPTSQPGRIRSFHHPAYVRERWACWLGVLDILQQAVYPHQDLVILVREAEERLLTAA